MRTHRNSGAFEGGQLCRSLRSQWHWSRGGSNSGLSGLYRHRAYYRSRGLGNRLFIGLFGFFFLLNEMLWRNVAFIGIYKLRDFLLNLFFRLRLRLRRRNSGGWVENKVGWWCVEYHILRLFFSRIRIRRGRHFWLWLVRNLTAGHSIAAYRNGYASTLS